MRIFDVDFLHPTHIHMPDDLMIDATGHAHRSRLESAYVPFACVGGVATGKWEAVQVCNMSVQVVCKCASVQVCKY